MQDLQQGPLQDHHVDLLQRVKVLPGLLGSPGWNLLSDANAETMQLPERLVSRLHLPILCRVGSDAAATPGFQLGDLVLIDQSPQILGTRPPAMGFLLETPLGFVLRGIGRGECGLFLVSEEDKLSPSFPEPFEEGAILRAIRGRIAWFCRQVAH